MRKIVGLGVLLGLLLPAAARATFPAANGRIAYVSDGVIHTINPDGSDDTILRRGYDPAWSANGRRIAFRGPSYPDIFTMRADGSHLRRVTDTVDWGESDPSFSPGGGRIVYARGPCATPSSCAPGSTAGGQQIVVARSKGVDRRTCTYGTVFENRQPEWAPDGKRIVFEGQTEDGLRILTMRPDCTDKKWLNIDGADPHYSANGRAIFFYHEVPKFGPVLQKMGPAGGHRQMVKTPVTFGPPGDVAPAPEGGCLVGSAHTDQAQPSLYAAGPRCPTSGWLTDNFVDSPAWQPLP